MKMVQFSHLEVQTLPLERRPLIARANQKYNSP